MHEGMDGDGADTKAARKPTPDEEAGWNNYNETMKPPANAKWPDRDEMDKLSTPERLDKMRELRKQRDDAMDRREAATRTFYAKLTAEQKKSFDANTGPQYRHRGAWGPRSQ